MPADQPFIEDLLVRPQNFETVRSAVPAHYGIIRFDSHERCNLFCNYCYHSGTRAELGRLAPNRMIDLEAFRTFLRERVLSIDGFQMGCGYEPFLDPRVGDFFEAVHEIAPPRKSFWSITNATLLHRYDPAHLRRIGLKELQISIDTVDSALHTTLRGGNLDQIRANIESYRTALPELRFMFSVVVTSLNIGGVTDLVRYAIQLNVAHLNFRQVNLTHLPSITPPRDIGPMAVRDEDFAELEFVLAPYLDKVQITFESHQSQVGQHHRYVKSQRTAEESAESPVR